MLSPFISSLPNETVLTRPFIPLALKHLHHRLRSLSKNNLLADIQI